MYSPASFRDTDLSSMHQVIDQARLANVVTRTASGLVATPLPLLLVPDEGPNGTLYGHLARANPQWRDSLDEEALVIFAGPEAYVSPSWYPSKADHHKVVPTWNYVAVHAYGPVEFFEAPDRLLAVVMRLTARHESGRPTPWSVADAPPDFVASMLRGIIGVRIEVSRLEGKRKLSQNRSDEDVRGVATGLAQSEDPRDQAVATLMRT